MNKKQYYKRLDEIIKAHRQRKQRAALVAGLVDVVKFCGAVAFVFAFAWLVAAFLYTC